MFTETVVLNFHS